MKSTFEEDMDRIEIEWKHWYMQSNTKSFGVEKLKPPVWLK